MMSVFRVMLQVQPGAEPDLQDVALRLGEDLAAEPLDAGIPHAPIAESGEDISGVETHETAPDTPQRPS
jgi:hypothetical protein